MKFAIGTKSKAAYQPLLPRSWKRLTLFAKLIQIIGMKTSNVYIARPSDISSPAKLAGSSNKLRPKLVNQYAVLRILPLNEKREENEKPELTGLA